MDLDRHGGRSYIVITLAPGPTMKARLVRIGNSRGIRLPKPLIEEAGLSEEVELRVREGTIIVAPSGQPRAGWADAARQLRQRREDALLEAPTPTRFDVEEWKW